MSSKFSHTIYYIMNFIILNHYKLESMACFNMISTNLYICIPYQYRQYTLLSLLLQFKQKNNCSRISYISHHKTILCTQNKT